MLPLSWALPEVVCLRGTEKSTGTAEERAGAGAKSVASVVPSAVGWRGSRARGVNGSA